jgi:hypothetical protein
MSPKRLWRLVKRLERLERIKVKKVGFENLVELKKNNKKMGYSRAVTYFFASNRLKQPTL